MNALPPRQIFTHSYHTPLSPYAIISILLPELYKSVMQLVGNTKTYYNTVYNWVLHLLESNLCYTALIENLTDPL